MRTHLLPATFFSALALISSANALADTPIYQRVDFSTEVAREISNDQMNATLSLEISDKNAGRLAQQISNAMNSAMKKASEYPAVKTTTGNQNTWPIYSSTAANKLESWRSHAEIRLESKDFKATAELIAKLQESMQLNGVSFVVSPDARRKVEDSLTSEAIAAFKTRADAIRTAWSAKSYRLVQMNLGTGGGAAPYMPMVRGMMAKAEDTAPQEMAGGETRLVVSVSGSIELQP